MKDASYHHVVSIEGISLFRTEKFSTAIFKAKCMRLRGIRCYVCSDAAFNAFGGEEVADV